jgi:excisionase family DNA binding protein
MAAEVQTGPLMEFVAQPGHFGPDEILTVEQVASYLKTSRKTAYRLVRAGVVPGFRVGAQWRVQKSALVSWIATQVAKGRR